MRARRGVREFARAMEGTLRLNEIRGKGDSWKTVPLHVLMQKLDEEYNEYASSMGNDKNELLDIAMVAMFLWHRARWYEAGGGSSEASR